MRFLNFEKIVFEEYTLFICACASLYFTHSLRSISSRLAEMMVMRLL